MAQVMEDRVVVDFSSGWPGSVATMVLSDFGAEVIKVEPPAGDPYRAFPQHLLWNRGKKSIVLDLETEDGRAKAQQLAAQADVVIESFAPGQADALGIGYDTLSANRPDLVYCSISAFGPKGPYANYKPYESVVAAKVGRYSVFTGQAGRPGPHYAAVNIAGHGTTMAALRGILSALIVRDRTGVGQKVETSLMQGITAFDISNWLIWQMMINFPDRFQDDPQSDPNRQPGVGYQPIRTKDGEWIQMANIIVRLFRSAIESMGLGDVLKDPRFEKAPTLMAEEREELRAMVIKRGLEKTKDEWMDIFVNQTSNVAAEPFHTTQQGMNHPQVVHNRHVVEVDDPRVGKMKQLGVLVRMSDTPGSRQGPRPGPRSAHPGSAVPAGERAGPQRQRRVVCGGAAGASPGGHHPPGPLHRHRRPARVLPHLRAWRAGDTRGDPGGRHHAPQLRRPGRQPHAGGRGEPLHQPADP